MEREGRELARASLTASCLFRMDPGPASDAGNSGLPDLRVTASVPSLALDCGMELLDSVVLALGFAASLLANIPAPPSAAAEGGADGEGGCTTNLDLRLGLVKASNLTPTTLKTRNPEPETRSLTLIGWPRPR